MDEVSILNLNGNELLWSVYIIWNLITALMMGWDKFKAKAGYRRIPEKTLMGAAVCFGGIGIFLGMQLFRHKTRHPKFTWGIPLCVLLNAGMIAAAIWFISHP